METLTPVHPTIRRLRRPGNMGGDTATLKKVPRRGPGGARQLFGVSLLQRCRVRFGTVRSVQRGVPLPATGLPGYLATGPVCLLHCDKQARFFLSLVYHYLTQIMPTSYESGFRAAAVSCTRMRRSVPGRTIQGHGLTPASKAVHDSLLIAPDSISSMSRSRKARRSSSPSGRDR